MKKAKQPNKAPEPTTMAVTIRAPSSTARASHSRGSSGTLGRMKSPIVISFLLLLLGLSGCSTSFSARKAQDVAPEFLMSIARTDTTDHVAYTGSAGGYHYFFHSQLFGGGSYKVAKQKMKMVYPAEFPLGAQEPVLLLGRFDELTRSWINPRSVQIMPNKAPEPTPLPVMPPAEPGVTPGSVVAHL